MLMESQQQLHELEDEWGKQKVKPRLSLERYIAFLQSRDDNRLTVGDINQIISIHAFKKVYRRKDAVEALSAIELIDPSRSTLHDNISSDGWITLPQVIKDITDLKWQECSITSVKTFNSIADYGTTTTVATTTNTTDNDRTPSKVDKRKPSKEKKSKPLNELLLIKGPDVSSADGKSTNSAGFVDDATDNRCAANASTLGASSSCCSSAIGGAGETTNKKRRKKGINVEAKNLTVQSSRSTVSLGKKLVK